jgi:hypothetical protein
MFGPKVWNCLFILLFILLLHRRQEKKYSVRRGGGAKARPGSVRQEKGGEDESLDLRSVLTVECEESESMHDPELVIDVASLPPCSRYSDP